jgi:hypothetical protein
MVAVFLLLFLSTSIAKITPVNIAIVTSEFGLQENEMSTDRNNGRGNKMASDYQIMLIEM